MLHFIIKELSHFAIVFIEFSNKTSYWIRFETVTNVYYRKYISLFLFYRNKFLRGETFTNQSVFKVKFFTKRFLSTLKILRITPRETYLIWNSVMERFFTYWMNCFLERLWADASYQSFKFNFVLSIILVVCSCV